MTGRTARPPTMLEAGPTGRRAGVARLLAVSFAGIAGFQASLALGAPLGEAAWGGSERDLSTGLRVASAFATGIWVVLAAFVLGRAGLGPRLFPAALLGWGTWVVGALLSVGTLMNAASSSPYERFVWAPIVLVLAVLCFVLARSPMPPLRIGPPGAWVR